jgi:hypothetical protein
MEKERSDKAPCFLRNWFFLVMVFSGLLSGCGKDGGVCVSNSGPIIKQSRQLPEFTRISLNDNVCLILTTNADSSVYVEAGQNIISGIKTTVENGQLTLSNSNTCNWLRDYKKPVNVYLPARKIWLIEYDGSGDVSSSGTLKMDSLKVEVWGGCGTIDLSLDIMQGSFSLNMGTVNFKLRGISAITSVYTGDYGLYDGRDLRTGYTFITSKGSNNCYVSASNTIEATIESIGDIYYTGNPVTVKSTITGTGKLLPL